MVATSKIRRPPTKLIGVVLLIDGIALEELCRLDLENGVVVGLCREHTRDLDVRVPTSSDVDRIAEALRERKVCYGKDGTVIAIAPLTDDEHYSPVPILLSPSCKKESGLQLADWLSRVIEVWRTHEYGERLHGPIHTLASDGESSFRVARFQLCMTEEVDKATPVGELLSPLTGLNLRTGPHGLLGTCDPKHVIKRFATMLRSPSGLFVQDFLLLPSDFLTELALLPDMTVEKARQLMDPADKQNVPKAVALIQKLMDLETKATAPTNPSDARRHMLVIFVAKTLGFFVKPFIQMRMDLKEQVRSHSTYSHLAIAMYLKHGLNFLTSALLADSLSITKAEMHDVARLQVIDRAIRYYIILNGTDRLEVLFSNVRTQDHSRNFDCLQLAQKLSIAAEIGAVLARNPDLDPGHKRLDVDDVEGVDHVNPRSVRGDVTVGSVELHAEWEAGRRDANALLIETLGPDTSVDFESIFRANGGDLLRPNGKDYIGSSWVADDARSEEDPSLANTSEGESAPPDPSASSAIPDNSRTAEPPDNNGPGDAISDLPIGMEIEDFLVADELDNAEQHRSSLISTPAPSGKERLFYNIDGQKYYKASYISALLTPENSRKVTLRPERARGVTVEQSLRRRQGDARALNLADDDGADHLKIKDLVGALVRVEKTVCFAVLEVRSLLLGTSRHSVSAVPLNDLGQTTTDQALTVAGHILELSPYSSADAAAPDLDTQTVSWRWTGHHLRFNAPASSATISTQKQFVVQVPGSIVRVLSPLIVPSPRSAQALHNRSIMPITWSLPSSDLVDALQDLWTSLAPDSDDIFTNYQLLPILSNIALPYCDQEGSQALYIAENDMPAHTRVVKKRGNTVVPCKLCDEKCAISEMRRHVGEHLMCSLHDVDDPRLRNSPQAVFIDPCGWCGLEGCATQIITRKGKADAIVSTCDYHYEQMRYRHAKNFSLTSPCTNVPLHCPLCPPSLARQNRTIWKYNALFHFATEHIIRADDGRAEFSKIPADFLVATFITKQEATLMGVTSEDSRGYRDEYAIPDSDAIELLQTALDEKADLVAETTTKKRPRGPTLSSVSTLKPIKRRNE
ncbi:hypothetical protein EV714DRAFT_276749 [Schizophyllum commune]